MQDDPWSNRVTQYQIGQLVQATITRLTKFGAFARLEDDLEGLIHISEISEKRIEHPKEVLKEGDTVTLRVIKIDPDNHRIGLSLRKVESMAYADMDFQSLEDIDETAPAAESPEVLDPKLVEAKAKAEAKEAKEAKAKAKAKAEPKVEAEPVVETEPKAEAEVVVEAEPKAEAKVVVEADPKAEAEGEAKPKAKAKKAKAEEAPEEKSE
jgi:predicted RNA-binding protein with RPS1 domain